MREQSLREQTVIMNMSMGQKPSGGGMNQSTQSFNPPSPFSPAQRQALQDQLQGSAVQGQTVISSPFDLTQNSAVDIHGGSTKAMQA